MNLGAIDPQISGDPGRTPHRIASSPMKIRRRDGSAEFCGWRKHPVGSPGWLLVACLGLCLLFLGPASHAAIVFDPSPSGGTNNATDLEIIQDTAAGSPSGQYMGMRFSSTTPLTNVFARAVVGGTGFSLDATETASRFVGNLSTTPVTSYWFINNPNTGAGTFQVQIYVGDPGAGGVLQGTSTAYVMDSDDADQAAAANKIHSVSINNGNQIVLGQSFTVEVVYTVNSTVHILVQPAASSAFDPSVVRLGNVAVTMYGSTDGSGSPIRTVNNQLYFLNQGSGINSVRATYTFLAASASSTSLSPLVSARSGVYKYNADFSVPPVSVTLPTPVNRVSVAKSASIVATNTGPTFTNTYTLTVTNSGSSDVLLDDLVDTLPPGASYAGNVKTNGVATTIAPIISGQTLTFSDPADTFWVPSLGGFRLSFDATIRTNCRFAQCHSNLSFSSSLCNDFFP